MKVSDPHAAGGARRRVVAGGQAEFAGKSKAADRRTTFGASWKSWFAERKPIWWFALKFCGLMALYYGLILLPVFDRLLYEYLSLNALLAGWILNALGQDNQVLEITIRSARMAITVRRGCDAIEPSWFFFSALMAFPAPLGRKFFGVLSGALLLQLLNLLRIVSLYFVGLYWPRIFGAAHIEIWPAVFIIAAISLWIGWMRWWAKIEPRATR